MKMHSSASAKIALNSKEFRTSGQEVCPIWQTCSCVAKRQHATHLLVWHDVGRRSQETQSSILEHKSYNKMLHVIMQEASLGQSAHLEQPLRKLSYQSKDR
ncbi:hypothetical protein ABW21_db0200146 [Orbilia brochopaga]|nr:hypothetical protein ABW21_db0200146 [Drechslerella brochopaga]